MKLINQATGNVVIQHWDSILDVNEKGEVTLGFGREVDTAIDILSRCVEFSPAVVDVQRRQAFYSLLDLPPDANLLRARIRQHELAYKLHRR